MSTVANRIRLFSKRSFATYEMTSITSSATPLKTIGAPIWNSLPIGLNYPFDCSIETGGQYPKRLSRECYDTATALYNYEEDLAPDLRHVDCCHLVLRYLFHLAVQGRQTQIHPSSK